MSEIWSLTFGEVFSSVDFDRFCAALRLVAHAQAGAGVSPVLLEQERKTCCPSHEPSKAVTQQNSQGRDPNCFEPPRSAIFGIRLISDLPDVRVLREVEPGSASGTLFVTSMSSESECTQLSGKKDRLPFHLLCIIGAGFSNVSFLALFSRTDKRWHVKTCEHPFLQN